MGDVKTGPGWSDKQWDVVNRTVTETFEKANVAGAFLPCYGPLADNAEYVRDEKLLKTAGGTLTVSDDTTLKLFNLTVKVELSSEQVADEGLSTALLAFQRAANLLAQVEDDIVFNGAGISELQELKMYSARGAADTEAVETVDGIDVDDKKVDEKKRKKRLQRAADIVVSHPSGGAVGLLGAPRATSPGKVRKGGAEGDAGDLGERLVTAITQAISDLEDDSHPGPFACVLGTRLFREAHRPVEKSMVLPADRIKPLLKGPLLRCGQMDDGAGLVVSLSGTDIDLVVATPPRAQFLQVTQNAKYLFRVYEKFTLRLKDIKAIRRLVL